MQKVCLSVRIDPRPVLALQVGIDGPSSVVLARKGHDSMWLRVGKSEEVEKQPLLLSGHHPAVHRTLTDGLQHMDLQLMIVTDCIAKGSVSPADKLGTWLEIVLRETALAGRRQSGICLRVY